MSNKTCGRVRGERTIVRFSIFRENIKSLKKFIEIETLVNVFVKARKDGLYICAMTRDGHEFYVPMKYETYATSQELERLLFEVKEHEKKLREKAKKHMIKSIVGGKSIYDYTLKQLNETLNFYGTKLESYKYLNFYYFPKTDFYGVVAFNDLDELIRDIKNFIDDKECELMYVVGFDGEKCKKERTK